MHTDWRYDPADLAAMFQYVEGRQVELGGRYDSDPSAINVWSHAWTTPDCKDESTLICGFQFDRTASALVCLWAAAGFDLDAALAELAILERESLGAAVYGRP